MPSVTSAIAEPHGSPHKALAFLGGGPGVVRDMALGGSVDVGVEDHSLLGSYRSSHLKLTRDFTLGFGPYPVLYFYPEKPREMQSSGMSMSPAVETSHPPLAHPPGDGTDLHPTPAVDVPINATPLWPLRPTCPGVRFTVNAMPMGFAMLRARSSNHSRRVVTFFVNLSCTVWWW